MKRIENLRVIKKRKKVNLQFNREVPELEWWDEGLLSGKKYQELSKTDENSSVEDKLKAADAINWT